MNYIVQGQQVFSSMRFSLDRDELSNPVSYVVLWCSIVSIEEGKFAVEVHGIAEIDQSNLRGLRKSPRHIELITQSPVAFQARCQGQLLSQALCSLF